MSWTFVQARQANAASLAYTSPNTLGNLLVAFLLSVTNTNGGAGFTITGFSSSAGNNWQQAVTESGSNAGAMQAWYCASAKAATDTVSATFNGGHEIILGEYSHSTGTPTLDAHASSILASGNTAPISITPAFSSELGVYATIRSDGGATLTPVSGWGPQRLLGFNNPYLLDDTNISSGTQTSGGTWAQNGSIGSLVMTFRLKTGVPNSLLLMGVGT
jgi:hypothetical protein